MILRSSRIFERLGLSLTCSSDLSIADVNAAISDPYLPEFGRLLIHKFKPLKLFGKRPAKSPC